MARVKSDIAKAIYTENFLAPYSSPAFAKWDADTQNTPYKDGKTTATLGWAIIYGNPNSMISILAGAMGSNTLWLRTVTPSSDTKWRDI